MTPEEEEAVRRALAEVPGPGPLPDEVADRLDAVLAGLVAERPATDGSTDGTDSAGADTTDTTDAVASAAAPAGAGAPVTPLAERRARTRRSRGRVLLVAAASVAVVGVGVGTVLDDLTGGADEAATESAVTADGSAGEEPRGPEAGDGEALAEGAPDPRASMLVLGARPATVGSDTLAADVRRLLDRPRVTAELTERGVRPDGEETAPDDLAATRLLSACDLPANGPEDLLVSVRLDGERGTLVVGPVLDGAREARVYSCADGDALLAATRVVER